MVDYYTLILQFIYRCQSIHKKVLVIPTSKIDRSTILHYLEDENNKTLTELANVDPEHYKLVGVEEALDVVDLR